MTRKNLLILMGVLILLVATPVALLAFGVVKTFGEGIFFVVVLGVVLAVSQVLP